jgi:hypothetical protein
VSRASVDDHVTVAGMSPQTARLICHHFHEAASQLRVTATR